MGYFKIPRNIRWLYSGWDDGRGKMNITSID